MNNKPHQWIPSPLGHGESYCVNCCGTNREIAVIGDMNHCPDWERQREKKQEDAPNK